tara:strand:- start:1118 stop:1306 length:189 start_codon:yes stop_codon:yes gene_type:complete
MNQAVKIALSIFGIYIFILSITSIASFVGLSTEDYINYLLWVVALLIFWLFLPKNTGSVFFN